MNVLVLTPDRVGSTLLQRLITIYMTGHQYDKPVINLHELTNGLETCFSPTFNQMVLTKPRSRPWGYYQTLGEVIDLLESHNHYKTCRLAKYHITSRNDSVEQQIPFYQYLNDNFYIIACRRENLFEHAISWVIAAHSKKLNVYTHDEKINTFYNIYKNGITVEVNRFTWYLNQYLDYLSWCDQYFRPARIFNYEKDLPRVEEYIMDLDIWPKQQKQSWMDIFNIEWTDWNRCHKMISDIGAVEPQLLEYVDDTNKASEIVELSRFQSNLSLPDQQYLLKHADQYKKVYAGIQDLVTQGILVTGVPIKLQTLAEKRKIIKNFDQCVDAFNIWAKQHGIDQRYNDESLLQIGQQELAQWYEQAPENLRLK